MLSNIVARLVLVFYLMCAASLHAEDVHRVIDENGRIKFTQFPHYKGAVKFQFKNKSTDPIDNNANNSQAL